MFTLQEPPDDIEKAQQLFAEIDDSIRVLKLKTITSVSGGKTSAYMALHYPTDYYVFACVLTEDPNCQIQDKGLLREIRAKVPHFEGSRELDLTLANVLRLEQELGKEIKWVTGPTFDSLICQKKMVPNHYLRFCTQHLKVAPIWEWTYSQIFETPNDLVGMNIGFRHDEAHRALKLLGAKQSGKFWDWSEAGKCEEFSVSLQCDLVGKYALKHRHHHKTWRIRNCPLFSDGIDTLDVVRYFSRRNWEFPVISNCDHCFFHRQKEHRLQHQLYPIRSHWWIEQEKQKGATFHPKHSLETILFGDTTPTPLDALLNEATCACSD